MTGSKTANVYLHMDDMQLAIMKREHSDWILRMQHQMMVACIDVCVRMNGVLQGRLVKLSYNVSVTLITFNVILMYITEKEKITLTPEQAVYKGNAPGFEIPLTVHRMREGGAVIFECKAYGKPFPQIKWCF
jgi:hypothetical protein